MAVKKARKVAARKPAKKTVRKAAKKAAPKRKTARKAAKRRQFVTSMMSMCRDKHEKEMLINKKHPAIGRMFFITFLEMAAQHQQ